MRQQFFWLWLLLWSLLCLYVQGFPVRRAKRTNENTEHVHISMHPTEIVHLSVDKKEEHGKKEENILNKLVVLLKDTVEKIPTQRPSDKTPVITFNLQPSPSVTVDTLWINRKPKNSEVQTQASQTDSSTDEIAKTTTPFWRLRNDSVATIILHTETTTKTTPERLQSESSATTVVYSDNTVSETPTVTASFLLEKISTIDEKSKTSNQLTKGTLSKLVESLKNMDKLHDMLHEPSDKPQQEGNHEGHMEGNQHKPEAARNLEVIDTVVKTIRNSPPSVKNDPALHNNVEKAKLLLQADLRLVGEAEKRLKEAKDQEEKERQTSPSPLPNLAGSEMRISLMPISSGQEQEKEREQQTSPSPPPHVTVSISEATLLVPVSPDQEENKREQQISPSPSPHLTVSEATVLLVPVSSDQEENKQDQQISPSPPAQLTVSDVTIQLTTVSSNSLAKKAEETQVKNGEFKSLIKLLYGFNGHAENPPNKKVARDIVNKTIAALDAINTISSGKADKSKKMLQQWFKKDMALPRKAIWKS